MFCCILVCRIEIGNGVRHKERSPFSLFFRVHALTSHFRKSTSYQMRMYSTLTLQKKEKIQHERSTSILYMCMYISEFDASARLIAHKI